MNLPRSGFYYKPKGDYLDQLKIEMDLRDRIEAICSRISLLWVPKGNSPATSRRVPSQP